MDTVFSRLLTVSISGALPEWMNGTVLKTVESGYCQLRGFESHTLLHTWGIRVFLLLIA